MRKQQKFRLPNFFVFLLLGIFPLFFTDKYRNITFSKFIFFMVTSVSALLLCFIFSEPVAKIFPGSELKNKNQRHFYDIIKSTDKLNISIIAFFITGLIAVIVSPYHFSSVLGYGGRYMGFDFIVAIICFYVFSLKYYRISENALFLFEGAGLIVVFIALLQFSGLNPLRLKDGIPAEKQSIFLSTIGNVNVFASYISLLLPAALYFICFSDKNKSTLFYLVCAAFGFLGAFISNSDSAYLALMAAFWFLILFSFEKNALHTIMFTLAAFFTCAAVTGLFFGLIKNHYRFSSLTALLLSTRSFVPAIFFAICGVVFMKIRFSEKTAKTIKYIFLVVSVAMALSAVSAVIYFSCFDKTTKLGPFENYIRFNDSWGTERGLVWRISLSAFKKMPFINKIFGYGEDTVVILLAQYFKDEMLTSGYYTDNAHNEFIQYLLTMGVAGLIAYISVLGFALKKLISRREELALFGALATGVFAYAVQSFVNITQPITTPLLFVFIAFANCETSEKQSLKRVNIKKY